MTRSAGTTRRERVQVGIDLCPARRGRPRTRPGCRRRRRPPEPDDAGGDRAEDHDALGPLAGPEHVRDPICRTLQRAIEAADPGCRTISPVEREAEPVVLPGRDQRPLLPPALPVVSDHRGRCPRATPRTSSMRRPRTEPLGRRRSHRGRTRPGPRTSDPRSSSRRAGTPSRDNNPTPPSPGSSARATPAKEPNAPRRARAAASWTVIRNVGGSPSARPGQATRIDAGGCGDSARTSRGSRGSAPRPSSGRPRPGRSGTRRLGVGDR